MKTVYGKPAVDVEQPDAEVSLYAIDPAPCDPASPVAEWRAWTLTPAEGRASRVCERVNGSWGCDCKDWLFRNRRNRTRRGDCKHMEAVKRMLSDKEPTP